MRKELGEGSKEYERESGKREREGKKKVSSKFCAGDPVLRPSEEDDYNFDAQFEEVWT